MEIFTPFSNEKYPSKSQNVGIYKKTISSSFQFPAEKLIRKSLNADFGTKDKSNPFRSHMVIKLINITLL
jgi:hypothetical protein